MGILLLQQAPAAVIHQANTLEEHLHMAHKPSSKYLLLRTIILPSVAYPRVKRFYF